MSESVISELQSLWGSSFFSKCSKLNLDFENAGKNWEKKFFFSENIIWILIVKLSLLSTGYFSSASDVLTSSPKIWHVNKRLFRTQFPCQWPMNMIRMLWCRFQQCLCTFTMWLVEESYETGLFRDLSNHVFRVRNFGNKKAVKVIFWFEMFKI